MTLPSPRMTGMQISDWPALLCFARISVSAKSLLTHSDADSADARNIHGADNISGSEVNRINVWKLLMQLFA